MPETLKVVQPTDKPAVTTEILAEAILSISAGVKKLLAGPINEDTLILLIQKAAPHVRAQGKNFSGPVGTRDIKAVLRGIEQLAKVHLKPKKP